MRRNQTQMSLEQYRKIRKQADPRLAIAMEISRFTRMGKNAVLGLDIESLIHLEGTEVVANEIIVYKRRKDTMSSATLPESLQHKILDFLNNHRGKFSGPLLSCWHNDRMTTQCFFYLWKSAQVKAGLWPPGFTFGEFNFNKAGNDSR